MNCRLLHADQSTAAVKSHYRQYRLWITFCEHHQSIRISANEAGYQADEVEVVLSEGLREETRG